MTRFSSSVSRPVIVSSTSLPNDRDEIAHGARERIEHRADRQHRQIDDVLPQFFGDQRQARLVVADVGDERSHAAEMRVERVGVLAQFRDPAARGRRQPRFADAIAQPRERQFDAAQLGVALGGLQALDDHLGRQVREAVQLLDRDAQRLTRRRAACATQARASSRPARCRSRPPARPCRAASSSTRAAIRSRLRKTRSKARAVDDAHVALRGHEQILELVRDLRDVDEAEHLRGALQAVRLAKDLGDDLRRLRLRLEA